MGASLTHFEAMRTKERFIVSACINCKVHVEMKNAYKNLWTKKYQLKYQEWQEQQDEKKAAQEKEQEDQMIDLQQQIEVLETKNEALTEQLETANEMAANLDKIYKNSKKK